MPNAPMFYKDAFGQWRQQNPAMAGRTFQGPNHAFMVYGSDGIAYPVGEQHGNNGEAGRQWDRPGDPVAAAAYDRLMQRAGGSSVLAHGFGGTPSGQWNANLFTAQDAAAVGAPAGLIRAATPGTAQSQYQSALTNQNASPAARAYLAAHPNLFNAHPISPPDPPPPPSGGPSAPPANPAPPVPDPFSVSGGQPPAPTPDPGPGPTPTPQPPTPQPQVKPATNVAPVPSPFGVAPLTVQPPKPADALTTTRVMPRTPKPPTPTPVTGQQKEATKFQYKQAGGVPSPFGTKNDTTSPFKVGGY